MIKVEEPSVIKHFKNLKDRKPKANWVMTPEMAKEYLKELFEEYPNLNDEKDNKDNKDDKENE